MSGRGAISAGAGGAFAPAVFWKLFIWNQENGGFTQVDIQFTRSLYPRSENPNCAPELQELLTPFWIPPILF